MNKKTVAVIGLGIMGHGIAQNFLRHGYAVVVWNRTPEKAADLVSAGATLAVSVHEAVEKADLVFEVTANDESSRYVWLKDGILDHAHREQYLITCATLSIDWIDELAQEATSRGLTFFDMPMTGGRMGAESGELVLLAGGDAEKLKQIEPDLGAVAKEIKYFGKAGSGMRYKLILNALQAIHILGFGEAMRLAHASGLDQTLVGDALAERPGGTTTGLAWRDYQHDPDPINFSVEWITKDLEYASRMSKDGMHPLLTEARKLYQEVLDKGYGQADWTKINKLAAGTSND